MLYINGPYFLSNDLKLLVNEHSWNEQFGMLYVEQPIAVGFSEAGQQVIPDNEIQLAVDLYQVLQNFYSRHQHFQKRPLYVTGEVSDARMHLHAPAAACSARQPSRGLQGGKQGCLGWTSSMATFQDADDNGGRQYSGLAAQRMLHTAQVPSAAAVHCCRATPASTRPRCHTSLSRWKRRPLGRCTS
jgi:hypothetical protein